MTKRKRTPAPLERSGTPTTPTRSTPRSEPKSPPLWSSPRTMRYVNIIRKKEYTFSSATPSQETFNIVEILENILLHLNYNDLIQCKRVSQKFKAVIDGSVNLRRILWLDLQGAEHLVKLDRNWDFALHPVIRSNPFDGDMLFDSRGTVSFDTKTAYHSFLKKYDRELPAIWKEMPCMLPAPTTQWVLRSTKTIVCKRCGKAGRCCSLRLQRISHPPTTLYELMSLLLEKLREDYHSNRIRPHQSSYNLANWYSAIFSTAVSVPAEAYALDECLAAGHDPEYKYAQILDLDIAN